MPRRGAWRGPGAGRGAGERGRSRRARAGFHYAQEVTCGVSTQCQTARAMSSLPSGNGVGHRAARAVLPVGRAVVFADQGRPGHVYVRSNTHAAYAPRDQARKPQALSAEARPVGNSWLDSLARLHSLHPWSQHAATGVMHACVSAHPAALRCRLRLLRLRLRFRLRLRLRLRHRRRLRRRRCRAPRASVASPARLWRRRGCC